MGRTIEFEGKSTQEALDAAVDQTGISLSSLKFEVVTTGGGGIFGLSLKKAKIRVFLEDDEAPEQSDHEEPSVSPAEELQESGLVQAREVDQEEADTPPPTDEPPRSAWAQPSRVTAPAPKKLKKLTTEDILQPSVPPGRIDLDLRDAGGRPARRRGPDRPRGRQSSDRGEPRSRRGPGESGRIKERPAGPRSLDREADQAPVRTARTRPVLSSTPPEGLETEHLETAREVLTELLSFWMPEAEVEAGWRDDKVYLNINGDSSGLLIGRKGQTLDALQFLVGKILDRKAGRHLRLMVDTEDYRSRREESLEQTATQLAEKALKSGKGQMTGPMNPHDRRIVHLALQDDGRFKTRSRGEGTYKRVIISLKD